jgi:hypothetical protein
MERSNNTSLRTVQSAPALISACTMAVRPFSDASMSAVLPSCCICHCQHNVLHQNPRNISQRTDF